MKNLRQTSVILLVNRAVGQKSLSRPAAEAVRSRRVFTGPEISRPRNLFQWMESGDEAVRRNARREMELLGFYPTEFCADYRNMTEVEFDDLIGLGVIYVADWDQGQSLGSPNDKSETHSGRQMGLLERTWTDGDSRPVRQLGIGLHSNFTS